ncbi:two-component system, OmpR family, response regulator [Thiohalospira halophila DSM 15071]|uniref:Two-component system, OmpR family, response regulator n=1 Tax=Thiohalospira halophila DSM 15071 TaxID=1123397 RepID=A0A1I1N5F1_9GAMM|nr:response regulator [Thiohalospira halophila]SFC92901.1 two-component system, OmpR family, response regulator [Thiohalospira halophila DSM 15071]
MRVLIAEDDALLGDGIQAGLRAKGFTIDWVTDGAAAEHAIRSEPFDLAVMDWRLPQRSGVEVIRSVRKAGITLPVLLLTVRDAVDDRIEGLDAGADDYLTKPFDLEELAARLRALARRRAAPLEERLVAAGVELDPNRLQVRVDGEEKPLGRREAAVLAMLMERAEGVVPREHLEDRLYGWDEAVASNALEVHIHHLRRKLGNHRIKTVRGVGYRFAAG